MRTSHVHLLLVIVVKVACWTRCSLGGHASLAAEIQSKFKAIQAQFVQYVF